MKRTIQSLSLSLLTALLFFRQRERCAGTAAARSDGSGGVEGDGSGVAHERDEPAGGVVLPEEPLPHAGCRAFFGAKAEEGGLVFEVKEIRVTPSKFLSAEEIRRPSISKAQGLPP